MGNCLVIQDRKEIKIMSMGGGGGEVLKMPSPPGSLSKAADDVIVDADAAAAGAAAVVRVKLVISKQELRKMLDKEGVSLDDMVSSLVRKEASGGDREQELCCGGWRPALESIPEGSDL